MDLFVLRNKKQVMDLCNKLMEKRLPFKMIVDDIYPIRSLDFNAYYWGIVLKYISDETGHDVEECHEAYKRKFNLNIEFVFNPEKRIYEPVFGVGSTADKNQQEFYNYMYKVRADGEIEHHILIPMPNEAFIPELDFKHDKIEMRRL